MTISKLRFFHPQSYESLQNLLDFRWATEKEADCGTSKPSNTDENCDENWQQTSKGQRDK